MAAENKRKWLVLTLVVVGVPPTAILGLYLYVSATATVLHPSSQDAPSVMLSAPTPKWAQAAERGRGIVRAALTGQNLPGLSVAVGLGGDLVWAEGFGWADLESRAPVSPDTRFRIGTASIALTSAGVGLLAEQGRLNLDEEIQTYVPEFPRKQWPVTLRQLMGHLSGIGDDGGDDGPLLWMHCARPADGVAAFAENSLLFEPGTGYRFSSYGWILLSAAVEAAADEPFLTFMQNRIFEPLGMKDTVADSTTEPVRNRASFYFPRFAADPRYGPDPMSDIDSSCYAGSSVFLSTPSDLVRFGMAINGGKLLQLSTVRSLQTSQRLPSGKETGYGLGWDLEEVALAGEQTRAIGHDGESLGGMVVSLMTFPEHGIVVAVASNISYADTSAVASGIAQAFAAQGKDPASR